MKILILGGTQFIGRYIVEAMLSAGHTVSILNRGKLPDEFPEHIERLRGDRDEGMHGLEILADRTWDTCIDVSGYMPHQVRPSTERLKEKIGRYIFISAVSVYGDPAKGSVYENNTLLPPAGDDVKEINSATYGPLKVACENIVQQAYGNNSTILRPQIVAGPHDPFDRFSYWVRRSSQGGKMLAPGNGSDYVQVIDVRDVAQFTKIVTEQNIAGAFNLAGHRLTWNHFMKVLGAENIIWVPAEIIQSAGLTEFELPLYRKEGDKRSSLMHVSNELSIQAGLNLSDMQITIKDTQAWLSGSNLTSALSPEIEEKLINIEG